MTPTCIRIKNLSVTEYLLLKIFVIIGLKTGLEPVVTHSICPQGEYKAVSQLRLGLTGGGTP